MHRPCSSLPPRATAWVALLAAAVASSGCADREAVIEAGRTRVTRAQLEAGGAPRGGADARALEPLVERALLAEAGRRAGLAEEREVEARLENARRELLAQAYLDRALRGATREDALRARYEQDREALARRRVHVAHVAVRIDPARGGRAGAESRAVRLHARIAAGEPFEKVAREASDDPVSSARGGDLGVIREGEVDPRFFEAAAQVAAGEISRPFETAFGFHVVKALAAPERAAPTFEEVRGPLEAAVRRDAQAALVAKLRQEIGVELHPERLGGAAKEQEAR